MADDIDLAADLESQMTEIRKFSIDLRLIDISIEFDALQEHLELLEAQLPLLREETILKLRAALEASGDADDPAEFAAELEPTLYAYDVQHPRLFRSSFFVMLVSVMEAAMYDICNYRARMAEHPPLNSLDRKSSEGLVEWIARYFRDVLQEPLGLETDEIAWLSKAYRIRNSLAHNNGRPTCRRDERSFEKLSRDHSGITYNTGFFLVLSGEFVREALGRVRGAVLKLVSETKLLDDYRRERGPTSNAKKDAD